MNLVLCYHHVSPTRRLFSTTPEEFERHLQALKLAGFACLSHEEFGDLARSRFASRARTVLVTFDDGHADNWFHARPILKAYDVPSVLFAITSVVAPGPIRELHEEVRIEQTFDAEQVLQPIRWSELRAWRDEGLFSVQTHTHGHRELRSYKGTPQQLQADMAADLALSKASLKGTSRYRADNGCLAVGLQQREHAGSRGRCGPSSTILRGTRLQWLVVGSESLASRLSRWRVGSRGHRLGDQVPGAARGCPVFAGAGSATTLRRAR